MAKQVDRDHYAFSSYTDLNRWSSYWYQIKEILDLRPHEVLEVGAGDAVVASYLRNNTDITYRNLDIARDLEPAILGDVRQLPLRDETFDLVCAFEILEHLPFADLDSALGELRRVSRRHVLLSLPHWGRHFSMKIFLPGLHTRKWQYKFDRKPIRHVFEGQHYWEIGKQGFPLQRIRGHITGAGLTIIRDYVAFESHYHHFFVLEKR
jgi:hypothetical protein